MFWLVDGLNYGKTCLAILDKSIAKMNFKAKGILVALCLTTEAKVVRGNWLKRDNLAWYSILIKAVSHSIRERKVWLNNMQLPNSMLIWSIHPLIERTSQVGLKLVRDAADESLGGSKPGVELDAWRTCSGSKLGVDPQVVGRLAGNGRWLDVWRVSGKRDTVIITFLISYWSCFDLATNCHV